MNVAYRIGEAVDEEASNVHPVPFLLLVSPSWQIVDADEDTAAAYRQLPDQVRTRIEGIRGRFGTWVDELTAVANRGALDWIVLQSEVVRIEAPWRNETRVRVEIQRQDRSVIVLEVRPDSFLNLMRSLMKELKNHEAAFRGLVSGEALGEFREAAQAALKLTEGLEPSE